MGLIARFISSLSPAVRRLERLASIGGESERLAASLKRHGGLCSLPRIREGLETLAAAEAADADVLRDLLLALGVWPARPAAPSHTGSNNWARLSADLAAEVELVRALNGAIADWEGVNPQIAERLRELVARKEQSLTLLRGFALKCDPQALD
ncbi:MAG TPA: hypothetical protein VKS22_05400 [Candidatus Binataceae bacterium]|nr:hypothetical protein [Candidatus Binataceae bacterium]